MDRGRERSPRPPARPPVSQAKSLRAKPLTPAKSGVVAKAPKAPVRSGSGRSSQGGYSPAPMGQPGSFTQNHPLGQVDNTLQKQAPQEFRPSGIGASKGQSGY